MSAPQTAPYVDVCKESQRVTRLTVIGYPLLALLLLSQALLQNAFIDTTSKGGLAACLLFLILYIIAYQFVDAPSFIWASEIWPTTIRAKGISLTFFAYFVGGLTYTTPSALAFKNMSVLSPSISRVCSNRLTNRIRSGWHMYLLYMGLCIISGIVVYFIIPETKGLPMEELAALFGDEVMVHLTADRTAIVEGDDGKIGATHYHVETAN